MENVIVVDARDKALNYKPDPSIPFDRFYLVKESALEDINRMVPYAIVVPLNEHYTAVLTRFHLEVQDLISAGYHVVVPINMTRLRVKGVGVSRNEVKPTYIASKRWWRKTSKVADFIPEDVTLVTPTGNITPMCVSCQKSLEHLQGECLLGSRDCVENMRVEHETMDETAMSKLEHRMENEELVNLKTPSRRVA